MPVEEAVEMAGAGAARIAHVTSLVGELARLDVSVLSHDDFLETYDAVARLGRLVDALRARFAGDLERRSAPDQPGGGLARRHGYGNAGTMVASVTGGSRAGAWRAIDAGRALMPDPAAILPEHVVLPEAGPGGESSPCAAPPQPRYPAVASAALAGDLSVDAAGLITAGLETLTDRVASDQLHALERRLVAKSGNLAAHEVRRLVASAVARADVAGHKEREERQYRERYLAWSEDHTGMVTLTGRLDPVTAAPLRTAIEQMVTHQFRARRDQDPTERDQRTVRQMRADALFALCRHALGCKNTHRSGIRTTVVVRMNLSDLRAGQGLGSVDGTTQPVSVGELRRLAGEAGIVPEVLGQQGDVLEMGRTVRMFTRAQRLALVERDGGCAKCHAPPEHCEAHHIRWWDRGGRSDLNNGVMLCTRCHHDIHRQGWGIAVRPGGVEFIPPPTIDPTGRPRPGGLAAITIHGDDSDDSDDDDPPRSDPPPSDPPLSDPPRSDPPPSHTRENSARATLKRS